MHHPSDLDPFERAERLQQKHEVCETAIDVNSALKSEREPDEYFVEFHISDKAIFEQSHRLPEEVSRNVSSIKSVTVEFRYTDPQSRPTVIFTISDHLGNISSAIKHEDSEPESPFMQLVAYGDIPQSQAQNIPAYAFNEFLAALIYPSKTGDFSQFQHADMFGQRAAQSLMESLRKRFDSHEEAEYRIPQLSCIIQGASIEEDLYRLSVAYGLPRTSIDTNMHGPGLEADIFTRTDDSSISLGKINDISQPKNAESLPVTSDDLRVLKEVLSDVLNLYASPAEVSLDRLAEIEATDDNQISRQLPRALDQDSFDSPDSSA